MRSVFCRAHFLRRGEYENLEPIPQSTVADVEEISFYGLGEVTLTHAYAANGLRKELDYLLLLDADRLLACFRANAKLPSVCGKTAYGGGWEGALIGGHTMGHYLSALAQAYENAGTPQAEREAIGAKLAYIVRVLKECQENAVAAGAKKGFLWGARVVDENNPEAQFDSVEAGRGNEDIDAIAWVPWYTMHKILAGLLDAYTHAGNETALGVARALGDWVYNRVRKWSAATQNTVLAIEYGGMNDALYSLYAITKNPNHAVAAHKFDEASLFTRILSPSRTDYLDGKHANTTIPKIIGALGGYIQMKATPVAGVDTSSYLSVARNFWCDVTRLHTYATGGNSEWEHFGKDGVLDAERTNANCETCNTYNMLKLSRMLFALQEDKTSAPEARHYLDYYENTYINAIWSSQNPETGMTTYFQPMASGYFKVYSTAEENFWCCTGSGMESFTKLNDSIYYKAGDSVYVSLYLSSTLKTGTVSLTQKADLENSDEITLKVDRGAATLRLRVPAWAKDFSVAVNGRPVIIDDAASKTFVSVDVQEGDTVKVHAGKTVTVHSLPDREGGTPVYAFKYGPFLLSAELGTSNMTTGTTGVNVTVPEKPVHAAPIEVASTAEGGSATKFLQHINDYMIKNADGTFTLNGTTAKTPYTFSYHYAQYTQRYAIYLEVADYGG